MKKIVVTGIFVIAAALIFWFFYPLRSYVVMSIYSAQHSSESVMRMSGFEIEMPSAPGWYPFVMTYNADGFSRWSGVDADMSILYNFGAFDAQTRTSSIYDKDSDRYCSFYGAYAVQKDGDDFGFLDSGDVDIDEVSLAVEYDYTQLVIKGFGCDEPVFSILDYDITPDIEYAGSGGWTRIDAKIEANGMAHNYAGYKTSYLQYGIPMQATDHDFEVITLYGRIYAKYFETYDCTVLIYVIAPNTDAIEECDNTVLEQTQINDVAS